MLTAAKLEAFARSLTPSARRQRAVRRRIAREHLRGDGIEIGALHLPLRTPRRARVRYVDRMGVDGLREHYPELADEPLVEVDVIDDGERLESLASASQDFVIANHFIEHCEDPLGTIGSHLRVLRPGGVLYLAVPDRRHTFDRDRPVTTLEHVVRDHRDGGAASRAGHYLEWARAVERLPDDLAPAAAQRLDESDYSIHFHVWEPDPFLEMLGYGRSELGLALEVQALQRNGHEFIVVLRRAPDEPPTGIGHRQRDG